MKYEFHIGQRVVCVSECSAEYDAKRFPQLPRQNQQYTIRDMLLWEFDGGESVGLLLHEIHNPVRMWWFGGNWMRSIDAEHPFWAGKFKPLDERATDISVFKGILQTTKAPELVD